MGGGTILKTSYFSIVIVEKKIVNETFLGFNYDSIIYTSILHFPCFFTKNYHIPLKLADFSDFFILFYRTVPLKLVYCFKHFIIKNVPLYHA